MSHHGVDYFTCSGKGTAINFKNMTIQRVLHNLNASTHENILIDTHALYIRYQNFTNFPLNLHEFLPNLNAIQLIGCGLRELNAEDLKNFINLKSLWLPLNHVEVLKNGVFDKNLKLKKLSLFGNRLSVIEPNVLTPLKYLKFVSFERNKCIDATAEGSDISLIMINEIQSNCTQP